MATVISFALVSTLVFLLSLAETTASRRCSNPPMIAIAIDSSKSIQSPTEYKEERDFVSAIALDLAENARDVAVASYATNVSVHVKFGQINKFSDLNDAITNLPYMDPVFHGSNLSKLFEADFGKTPEVFLLIKKETNSTYPDGYRVPDGKLVGVKKVVVTFGKESNIREISDFYDVIHYNGLHQFSEGVKSNVVQTLCYALVSTLSRNLQTEDLPSTNAPDGRTLVSFTSTYQLTIVSSKSYLLLPSAPHLTSGSTVHDYLTSLAGNTYGTSFTRMVNISGSFLTWPQTTSPSNLPFMTYLSTSTPKSLERTTTVIKQTPINTDKSASEKDSSHETNSALITSSHIISVTASTASVNGNEHDNYIKELLDDLNFVLDVSSGQVNSSNETFVKYFMSKAASLLQNGDVLDRILNSSDTVNHLRSQSTALTVLRAVELFSQGIGEDLTRKNRGDHYKGYESNGLVSRVYVINIANFQGQKIGSLDKDNYTVFVPNDIFNYTPKARTRGYGIVVNLVFTPFEVLQEPQAFERFQKDLMVASKIVNVFTSPQAIGPFRSPVRIAVRHSQLGFSDPHCVFWESVNHSLKAPGKWSTEGCHVFSSVSHFTECQCNHMTNYAVLMRTTEQELNPTDEHVLTVLTYVGCSFSIFGVFLTVITFLSLPVIKTEITKIHLNLSIAIGTAQVLFLAAGSVKLVHSEIICKLYAGLLFYLFMCVFTWMFVEGIHLYQLIVIAFVSRNMSKFYFALGWGLPACAVVIASSIAHDGFGTSNFCWISPSGGTIWAFVGPVMVISGINLFVLFGVLRVRMNISKQDGLKAQLRTTARVSLVLVPLLGVTWLFGVLAVNRETVVFQYVFTISNSMQGLLIFIFHCAGNSEVRREFQRKASHFNLMKSLTSPSSAATARVSPTPVEEINLEDLDNRRLMKNGWVGLKG